MKITLIALLLVLAMRTPLTGSMIKIPTYIEPVNLTNVYLPVKHGMKYLTKL